MENCQRCGKPTIARIMSMFNTEEICMDRKDAEKQRPDYDEACRAEREALQRGDRYFAGFGLR